MVGRSGRTQKIAYDETPLNAPRPDLGARLGWLLAMSRLHHRAEEFQDGTRFAESLGRAGFPASRSLVSRWESGRIPISFEGMAAYERVLSLEPGRITSVVGYLRSLPEDPAPRAARPRLDPGGRDFAVRFDELIDAAEQGTALARQWQELGWHLSAAPMVHLRAQTWDTLSRQVVTLLPRSVNVAYCQLSTAAMSMATVPRAQDFLVDAIATYMSDPAVQVVANPLVLLDHLPTREAARLVLEVVEKPQNLVTYQMGIWLATQKMVRGEFSPGERSEVQMLVLRAWRRDPSRAGSDLAELIAELPEGMRSTLVQAAVKAGRPKLGYVVEHGEEAVAATASAFATSLAASAREGAPQEATYAEDRMLTRLLREALFHRDTERRHCAALLVAASPFAASTCDALLGRLARSGDPAWLRVRMSTLVRYLCNDSHRQRMLPFLHDPDEQVAVPVVQGLGHLSFSPTCDQEVRASLVQEWSARERAKLYALGMTGSPGLAPIAASEGRPRWQRSAARWWLDPGSAVRA